MSSPQLSALTHHLGYWLRLVSNHVSHAFAQKLAAADVTVAEWVVLRALYDQPHGMAPSALATEMGATRGAITKLADRLLAKKLLLRTASPHDGRAQTLCLTPAGRQLVPKLAKLADANDAEFFDHLTARQRQALMDLLQDTVNQRGMTAMPTE